MTNPSSVTRGPHIRHQAAGSATQFPLGAHGFIQLEEFVFYFWFGVTLLCILALMFVLVRHFKSRLGANATI